jgi:hypothetical protein
MFAVRRSLVVALVASAALAPSAFAKGGGGGGGGGGSTPPVQPTPAVCDTSGDGTFSFGTISTSPVYDAGCLTLQGTDSGLALWKVTAAPGWSYDIKNSGGTDGRIDVTWTNGSTGQRHEVRIEPGKTVID